MAVTFKQLLNRALRITGEDEIPSATSTVTDTFQLLVAEAANEIKEEVEAAHNWRALRWTTTIPFTANETNFVVTGGTEKSRICRVQDTRTGRIIPLAYDITDASSPVPLHEWDLPFLIHRNIMDAGSTGDPVAFALDNSDADELTLYVYPETDGAKTVQLTLIRPQPRLDAGDATDLATNILVPVRPIVMGLVRFIYEERGEELGPRSMYSAEKWEQALQDAIALDLAEQGGVDLMPV